MQIASRLAIVLLAFALIGCGKHVPSKLLGTWLEVLPNGAKGEATFGPEDSYRFESSVPRAPDIKVIVTGKFREDADLVFITAESVQLQNLPDPLKSQEKEMTDKMKDTLDVGTENSAWVTWQGPDSFVTTSADKRVATFQRKILGK